jgi:hypothetical protein
VVAYYEPDENVIMEDISHDVIEIEPAIIPSVIGVLLWTSGRKCLLTFQSLNRTQRMRAVLAGSCLCSGFGLCSKHYCQSLGNNDW